MNTVNIIGNLTTDPEIIDDKRAKFSIAYNSKFTDRDSGEKREEVSYFKCVAFTLIKPIGQYLKKGDKVGISGSLKQNRWEKDGEKKAEVTIIVDSIDFLSNKRAGISEDSEDWG